MTDNTMAEKNTILNDFRNLQQTITGDGLMKIAKEMDTQISGMVHRLTDIRSKGYVFGKDLQPMLNEIETRWRQIESSVRELAIRRSERLGWDMRSLQDDYNNLAGAEGMAAQIYMNKLSTELSRIKSEVESAERQIEGMAGDLPQRLREIGGRIDHVERTLKRAAEATFAFGNGENLYVAVEAEWKKGRSDKENPDGVFYITDKRLIMEQREKQGGFLGMGGKKVQGLSWEAALETVQNIRPEKAGLLGGVDLIHFQFGPGGPFAETTIEVKGGINANDFAAQLQNVLKGGLAVERIG